MKDCFAKTLEGELNNSNLPVYDKITIHVNSTGSTTPIKLRTNVDIEIVGDGYFVTSDPGEGHWSDGTNKDTSGRADGKYKMLRGSTAANVLVSAGEYDLLVYDKYNISEYFILTSIPAYCSVNINDFNYCIYNNNSSNARLNSCAAINNANTKGDVAELLRHAATTNSVSLILQFYNTSVTLNLEELLGNDITCNISKLWLQNCPNVTNKDATTLAAIRAKFTGIDLVV